MGTQAILEHRMSPVLGGSILKQVIISPITATIGDLQVTAGEFVVCPRCGRYDNWEKGGWPGHETWLCVHGYVEYFPILDKYSFRLDILLTNH